MKKTLIHIHHTLWITFIFFLLLAALLISAARLATPWLEKQKPFIEKWTSALLEQPVTINQLAIHWEGFQPILQCNEVTILNDAHTEPLLHVDELDIGINLIRSMVNGHFQLGRLRLKGLFLTVQRDSKGQIIISGINTPLTSHHTHEDTGTFSKEMAEMFAGRNITLQDLTLHWYDNKSPLVIKHMDSTVSWQPLKNGGQIKLKATNALIDFGRLFRAPVYLNTLNADLNWQQAADGWHIKAKQIVLSNADARINTQFDLRLPADNSSPYLNLLAGYQIFSAQHVNDYLPLTVLSPELVQWLNNAVLRFADIQGTLVINGNLKEFPFEKNNGVFIVDSQIKDGDLAYWPKWPLLKHFSGELVFAGSGMKLLSQSGQVFASQVKQLTATIPLLKKGALSVLQINGQLTGDLTDAVRFLRESPLNKLIKNMNNLQVRGPYNLQLGLTIPLHHNLAIKVAGQLDTQNAVFALPDWNLQMPRLQGRLFFTENGLSANNLTATLWQKPVTAQIRTLSNQQGMAIQLTGQVASQDLQRQFKAKLLNSFSGTGNYTVVLHVGGKNEPDDLTIMSDLKGVAVDLSAPLAKTALQTRSLELTTNLSGVQPLSYFNLNYGDLNAVVKEQANAWSIKVQSPMASGNILLPFAKYAAVQANFQHLYLAPTDTDTESHLQPQDVPNLYFTCQDFRYGNKLFGAVALNLKQMPEGAAITRLQAISPAFKLTATGDWYGRQGQDWTTLTGVLTSQDIAAALASWGLPSAGFSTKNSNVNFALQWQGSPYSPSLAKIKGDVALDFKEGQLTEVGSDSQMKMNIGRLLTFTSWQSIARRLQLDFSDLTRQGYSFNHLKGNFALSEGNAITKNTVLDGPVAKLIVTGRIGLVAEDFDLYVGVTPHLSSSLSVIAGIAGGPILGVAAGAASWLADKVMGSEVEQIVTDHYRLAGPWSKPEVTKYEGKPKK